VTVDNGNPFGEEGPFRVEFGAEIDLHHFSPRYTGPLVREFLDESVKKGYGEVRIVHGKGRSQKKQEVYRILETHPYVISFHDQGPNWGATVVFLKRKSD